MFGDKGLIGVDLGAYAIKAVRLAGHHGAYTLEAAASMRLPAPEDSRLPLDQHLAHFIKTQKIRGTEAASALSGPSLVFRHLTLPVMPEKELAEAVRWELRKEMAVPANELVTDYVSSGSAGDVKQTLIAFAARRPDVDGVLSTFRAAGLELKVINVVPTALLAVFNENNDWDKGMSYAMIDMGHTSSVLCIFRQERLVFTREITFGGRDLTSTIAGALHISTEEAEEYKHSHGLDLPPGDAPKLKDALTSLVERLCSEIHRSIDYYQAQFRGGALGLVFISGGTAATKGIDDFISETLGLACFVHDPFKKIKLPGKHAKDAVSAGPALNVATGLAVKVSG